MVKDFIYTRINRVNHSYLITNKMKIEESNGNKYLTLVPTDEIKGTLKTMENYVAKSEIW